MSWDQLIEFQSFIRKFWNLAQNFLLLPIIFRFEENVKTHIFSDLTDNFPKIDDRIKRSHRSWRMWYTKTEWCHKKWTFNKMTKIINGKAVSMACILDNQCRNTRTIQFKQKWIQPLDSHIFFITFGLCYCTVIHDCWPFSFENNRNRLDVPILLFAAMYFLGVRDGYAQRVKIHIELITWISVAQEHGQTQHMAAQCEKSKSLLML